MLEYIKISEFRKSVDLAAQGPEAVVRCASLSTLVWPARSGLAGVNALDRYCIQP